MGMQFSLREHKTYASYNPAWTFTKPSDTLLRQTTTNPSLGKGYVFIVIPRTWLDGKYIRFNWRGVMSSYSNTAYAQIWDGSYDRSSAVDFPSGSAFLVKGNGLLQTLGSKTGTFSAETIDALIDVSGGSKDNVTLFFTQTDSWSAQNFYQNLDWVEINNDSGGIGNFYSEHFTGSITMEQSGGVADYGYIGVGEVVAVYSASANKSCNAVINHDLSTSINRACNVDIAQIYEIDLSCNFAVKNADTSNRSCSFSVQASANMSCNTKIRNASFLNASCNAEILNTFALNRSANMFIMSVGSYNRSANAEIKNASSNNLSANAEIKNASSNNLSANVEIKNTLTTNKSCNFVVLNANEINVSINFEIQKTNSNNVSMSMFIRSKITHAAVSRIYPT